MKTRLRAAESAAAAAAESLVQALLVVQRSMQAAHTVSKLRAWWRRRPSRSALVEALRLVHWAEREQRTVHNLTTRLGM